MGSKIETDFDWYTPKSKLEKKNRKIEAVQNKQYCLVFAIDRIIQMH